MIWSIIGIRKVESGHISISASKDNIIPMLSEILLIFQLKSEEQQIEYTIDLPQEEVELFFDSSKIEIILTNLLSNAFKYTASGGKIQVRVRTVGNSSEEALLSIINYPIIIWKFLFKIMALAWKPQRFLRYLTLIFRHHIPKP
jgi:signal transduction histidine kinase